VTTHNLGWECRRLVDRELLQSTGWQSQEEVFGTGMQWNAAR
jgi:hypothetical protein